MNDKQLDNMYKRKQFLKIIFSDANLKDEYIRILQIKDEFQKVTFWQDIDDLNTYIETNSYNTNTYFSLSTTDGTGGTTDNLKYRYCLAWDFDKKLDQNLDAKELMFRFKKIGLWFHAIVDSGHGFHVYLCIKPTNDIKKVVEIEKSIANLVNADINATSSAQVLRVPLTYNLKEEKPKRINIIHMFNKNTIKKYDIEGLHKQFCSKSLEDRTIQYAIDKTKMPPCILEILKGVEDGDRNFCMLRLISFLKLYKYSESESFNIIKEWNNKNDPPVSDNELEYQFNYIWNKSYTNFGCKTDDINLQMQINKFCNKDKCSSLSKGEIVFVEGETISMEHKLLKKVEKQRKNVFQLKGNHLLIISVLKNNLDGLTTEEITSRITYKNKCYLSNKTLGTVLNELTENKYLTKFKGNKRKKEKDFYKLNIIKCEEIEKFNISYFAVLGVIKENISAEDFKIYCYMRYRLNKKMNVTQENIGEELGLSRQAIQKHISKLIEEKYLEIKYIDYSIHPLGANIYRVNY